MEVNRERFEQVFKMISVDHVGERCHITASTIQRVLNKAFGGSTRLAAGFASHRYGFAPDEVTTHHPSNNGQWVKDMSAKEIAESGAFHVWVMDGDEIIDFTDFDVLWESIISSKVSIESVINSTEIGAFYYEEYEPLTEYIKFMNTESEEAATLQTQMQGWSEMLSELYFELEK